MRAGIDIGTLAVENNGKLPDCIHTLDEFWMNFFFFFAAVFEHEESEASSN